MSCENCEESAYVIDKLAKLLAEIAIIVNGPEPPLTRWSYHDLPEKVRALKQAQKPAALAVPAEWRVMWFTGSFKRGSERWEIYDPEGNGGAVDKGDIRDDMVRGLLDALAAERKGGES